ncbi:uncharacterized protein BDFB_008224, partial [Asbolus verrucosus]
MISRRENLLVRPWEQRRYDNHRRKVQSAGPAIDNKQPLPRQHVALKLKKKQKETERCQEIERNNFNLLKRLSYVMRTSRVDNNWTTPQPNFLNRVSIYDVTVPEFENLYIEERRTGLEESNRKSKCFACTPHPLPAVKIPEERVPWEPEKPSVSRVRSKSVPARKPEMVTEKIKAPKSAVCRPVKSAAKVKNAERADVTNKMKNIYRKEPQSIVLSRGCLKLSVNFPSDTLVKLQEGSQEKTLVQGACNCKNPTPLT